MDMQDPNTLNDSADEQQDLADDQAAATKKQPATPEPTKAPDMTDAPSNAGVSSGSRGSPGAKAAVQPTAQTSNPLESLAQHFAQIGRTPSRPALAQAADQAPARAQAREGRQQAPASYQRGPTDYVGFGQTFGANAGAAREAARGLVSGVRRGASDAYSDLEDQYGAFQGQVGAGARQATRTGEYTGPTDFDTSGLADDFAQAQSEVGALNQGAGGVQALRPRTSRFGASLTASAAQPSADQTEDAYSGLGEALSDARTEGRQYADDRAGAARTAYDEGVAETDRLLTGGDDPYEVLAREQGYPDLDTMLREGYESMGSPGTFDEYKARWFRDRERSSTATAAAE